MGSFPPGETGTPAWWPSSQWRPPASERFLFIYRNLIARTEAKEKFPLQYVDRCPGIFTCLWNTCGGTICLNKLGKPNKVGVSQLQEEGRWQELGVCLHCRVFFFRKRQFFQKNFNYIHTAITFFQKKIERIAGFFRHW